LISNCERTKKCEGTSGKHHWLLAGGVTTLGCILGTPLAVYFADDFFEKLTNCAFSVCRQGDPDDVFCQSFAVAAPSPDLECILKRRQRNVPCLWSIASL